MIKTRADGVILVDEKPFFPVGVFHSSHHLDDTTRLTHLTIIARAGFNVIATTLNLNNGLTFLDKAKSLGVYVLVENNDVNGLFSLVNKFKGHPGLLGYQIEDDVDDGKKTVEQVIEEHNKVKTIDPSILTHVSAGTFGAANYIKCADLFSMQTYPVDYEPLSSTYNLLTPLVTQATAQNKIVIANTQSFAWEGRREPSPAEARCMAYLSLIAGAKGMIWYAFYDEKNVNGNWVADTYLPNSLALWRETSVVGKEFTALAPIVLDPITTRHVLRVVETSHVKAGMFVNQGKYYIVICNTSNERRKVTVQFPAGIGGGTLQPRFGTGNVIGCSVYRALTVELEPFEVKVMVN